jgi:hypothetical protein
VTTPRDGRAVSFFLSTPLKFRFLVAALCFITIQLSSAHATPPSPSNSSTAYSGSLSQRPDQPYGLIFGTVWGPDDHPLYGVKVKIRRADQKKPHWEIYSDHHGEFAQRVPPGPADYLVAADLKGYKSLSGKELHQDGEVKVHIDNDEREDIGLHLKQ